MTENRILPLRDAEDVRAAGGKAVSLGNLIRLGLPVPEGFVVPTAQFREHVARSCESENMLPEEKMKAIMRTPVSAELRVAVEAMYESFGNRAVAVRSSATAEDSASASFAGQFITVLNLTDSEEILKAIQSCWSSVFSERVRAYAGVADTIEMAVVIQEMIPADFAGVAFTSDPLTNSDEVLYIEWVKGLGEVLVSGERIDGRIWCDAEGGDIRRIDYMTDEGPYPEDQLWRDLTKHLVSIQMGIDRRQDVEWAFDGTSLFILQARPITAEQKGNTATPDPWLLPGRPKGGWTEKTRQFFDLWDEYNPVQIYPLAWSLYYPAIMQASVDMLDFGSNTAPTVETFVVVLDGVPIMLDPEARIQSDNNGQVREHLCRDMAALTEVREKTQRMKDAVGDCSALSDRDLRDMIIAVSDLYRDALTVRLLVADNERISQLNRVKKDIAGIIKPLNLVVDTVLEVIEGGVDDMTSMMNRDLATLARRASEEGRTAAWESELNTFFETYGHCSINGERMIKEQIKKQVENMTGIHDNGTDDIARQRAEKVVADIREKLSGTSLAKFTAVLEEYKKLIILRERYKWDVEIPMPLFDRVTNEVGSRLTKQGILNTPTDIHLLTIDEISAALRGESTVSTADRKKRVSLLAWREHVSWLPVGYLGRVYTADDTTLKGTPASPGSATGPAAVVTGPDEFSAVSEGAIVIARATNPMWTQIFSRIGGIIVENGSTISHAAIVAREYGIPAVVGVPGATEAFNNGEMIIIDGETGTIVRQKMQKF